MTIRKITDAEVEAASVARLSTRPNESGGYGKAALTATELKNAFDALGKLCAARYNELVDGFSDGSAASLLTVDGIPLSTVVSEKADKTALDEGLKALDAAQKTHKNDAGMAFANVSAMINAVKKDLAEVSVTTEENREAVAGKLEKSEFDAAPAVTGGEKVALRLNTSYTGGFPFSFQGECFLIPQGTELALGNAPALLLGEFDVQKGETYYVYTEEKHPAVYYADKGDAMATHIRDGMRLRVTLDADGDGGEDRLYKLNNYGCSVDRVRYTSEPVVFRADEDGVARVTLSVYNTTGALRFPFLDADTYVTPRVSRERPHTPLSLDGDMKPSWQEDEKLFGGDALFYGLPASVDAVRDVTVPLSLDGDRLHMAWCEDGGVTMAFEKDSVRLLKGSRANYGAWMTLRLGAFDAERGRSYRVKTRESHIFGGSDGYKLGVMRGDRLYTSPLYGNDFAVGMTAPASDTADGFVFTAAESGRHFVVINLYVDDDAIPVELTEDVVMTVSVTDVTPSGTEGRKETLTVSGETRLFDISAFAEGKPLSEAESITLKLLSGGVGDVVTLCLYDGNGKEYRESVTLQSSVELLSLDVKPWVLRRISAEASSATESVSLYAGGRNTSPSTGLCRMSCSFTPTAEKSIRYDLFVR